MSLDGISVLVPTYGRTRLLAEVVECYLRQDWTGPSELVIFNDLQGQHLKVEVDLPPHKDIQVFNTTDREPTLGDKRNTLLSMARYPIVTYWDDDDIYLPHRLSLGFVLLHDYNESKIVRREVAREHKEWRMLENGLLELRYARPFGTMTALKSAIQEVGGFPALERLQDVALVNKLVHANKMLSLPQVDWIPSTIYRLNSSVGFSGHVSNAPNYPTEDHHNPAHNAGVRQYMVASTAARLQLGEEPTGDVLITPRWDRDYLTLAEQTWETQKPRLIQ